jgi:hypothetical protein
MCEPTTLLLVSTGLAAAGAGMTAYGQYQQGQAAEKIARNNQIMGEYAAQDAQARGEEDAMAVSRKGEQLKGAQRSRMAASGIDLGVGTAADIQDQTDFFAQQDINTARSNARRDAWAFRAQGANAAAQGRFAAQQGQLQAFSTLLSGAGQVASMWSPAPKKG